MSDIYSASTPDYQRTNPQNPQRFSYQSSAYPEDPNYQPTAQPLTADHTASSNFINPYGEGSSSSNNPFLEEEEKEEEEEEEEEEERIEREYTPTPRRNSTSKRPLSLDDGTPRTPTRASLPPPKYSEAYPTTDLFPPGAGLGEGGKYGDPERLRGGSSRPDSMAYSGTGSYTGRSSYGYGSEEMRNGVFLTRLEDLGKNEAVAECPRCRTKRMTRGRFVAGACAHITAAVGCMMLCCWIPYVTTFLKDVEHRCGHCGVILAVWSKGGGGTEVKERKRMTRTHHH